MVNIINIILIPLNLILSSVFISNIHFIHFNIKKQKNVATEILLISSNII